MNAGTELNLLLGVCAMKFSTKLVWIVSTMSSSIDINKVYYKSFQHLHHNIIQLFEVPIVYNKVNTGPFAKCCGIDSVRNDQELAVTAVSRIWSTDHHRFWKNAFLIDCAK
ncbi:hypothetical protein Ddc_18490 [Ditylenchus destructor]|nr:hypothetical protein Ddc_18490 [Ditylenchus destructor]